MKVIENNYKPKEIEVKHIGYRQICQTCASVVIVENRDIRVDGYYTWYLKYYICPCCGHVQNFMKDKRKEEEWVEKILK